MQALLLGTQTAPHPEAFSLVDANHSQQGLHASLAVSYSSCTGGMHALIWAQSDTVAMATPNLHPHTLGGGCSLVQLYIPTPKKNWHCH